MKPYEHFACLQAITLFSQPKFFLAGQQVGWIENRTADAIHDSNANLLMPVEGGYRLKGIADNTYNSRSTALAQCFNIMLECGLSTAKPQNEMLPIASALSISSTKAERDRSNNAIITPGRSYAVVIYTLIDGERHVWVGQRANDRKYFPDKWDILVGGNLEAGKTDMTVATAQAANIVGARAADHIKRTGHQVFASYIYGDAYSDIWHTFELEVPNSFTPADADSKMQAYRLLSPAQAARELDKDIWRPDSAAVLADFCLRHGIIVLPDEDKARVQGYLTRSLPFTSLQRG